MVKAATKVQRQATHSETEDPALKRREDENEEAFAERQRLLYRLSRIRHKVVVLSGKVGVGKGDVRA